MHIAAACTLACMPEGRQPRRVTPRPRSGAAAESARLRGLRNSREELPHVRGQRGRPRGDTQRPRSGAATRGVTPHPKSGAAAGRRYLTPLSPRPEAAAGGATPHLRPGTVAGRTNPTQRQAQEGLEELSHVEGQEWWW